MLSRRSLVTGLAALGGGAFAQPRNALAAPLLLFQQPPIIDGIDPNFSVTGAPRPYNPVGQFYLHANQPNPFSADNNFVPVYWDAAAKTGLAVPADRLKWQRGIFATPSNTAYGRTIVQMYGGAVGAFLNSADLVNGSPDLRMMVSPNYLFATAMQPFASSQSVIAAAFDLQVPIASSIPQPPGASPSNCYVKLDMLFGDNNSGTHLSYSCGVFNNRVYPKKDSTGFDNLALSVIVAAQVTPPGPGVGQLVSLLPGSNSFQIAPWLGWKHFAFTISQAQFAAGLSSAQSIAMSYGYQLSSNPADYTLLAMHLNAELHYTATAPTTLGWSMQNLTLTQLS